MWNISYILIALSVLLAAAVCVLVVLLQMHRESKRQLKIMVKRRTMELEFQRNAAEAAYQVKSRFLANMSHEIRTPLNAIIGLSQAELEKNHAPESKENLDSINRSGSTLLALMNDLLDISGIESGDLRLNPADYSLPMFISTAAGTAKLRIGNKPIELQLEVDENLPLKLHGDKQRLKQIIGNLLSNAVKFTNEGSILFRAGFEQEAEGKLTLILEVCDTGIGIKREHIAKLFSDYSQVDTDAARSAGGTGMGLVITKKLAVLMGGDVNVVSEYGKGSVFTAWIPQTIAGAAVLGKETAQQLETLSWKEAGEEILYLPYARALVVDDVPTNHAVARGIMRPYRMTIDTVLSGREAVDRAAKEDPRYDVIFMDHMMPDMDGIEAARRIRELDTEYAKNIPIIALTANVLPGNEELFLANGFNAFLPKPINVNLLTSLLNTWVRDEEQEKRFAGEPPPEEARGQYNALTNYVIDGVDLEAGAAQFGGEKNYLEIVKVFVNDTPKLLKDVEAWLDRFRIMPAAAADALKSLKNYTITVHGIKGSCYGICAARAGDLAKELEMAAKSQDLGRVIELNNRFVEETKKLVDELKVLFPQKEEKSKPYKNAPDTAALQQLLEASLTYNINTMLEVLDELERYEYREDAELVSRLRQAVDNYEYGDVVTLLHFAAKTEDDNEIASGAAG